MATIYIDDVAYEVEEGKNLLETVLSLGLNLPYFCWHPAMDSVGACRQCAVIGYMDENDTRGRLKMACMERVTDGMRVSIEAEKAHKFRAANIEALMINHPHDCPVCDEGGECHLQDMVVMSGHNYRRYEFNKRTHYNQFLGPFIHHEMNRCIQCYRCVRFYNDYADGEDFNVFHAHDNVYFGRTEDGILENEFSGNLVEVCPTGVFTDKTLRKHYTRKWDLSSSPSIDHTSGLGSNILVSERYGITRRILSRYNGDVNGYFISDRARFGYEYTNSDERILHTIKKINGELGYINKETALNEVNKILTSNKRFIGIGSPRASLESNYMLQKLVGKENFYGGIPNHEGKLIRQIIDTLRDGRVRTPSMAESESFDAVLILGEDVTNTAPRLALSLRQTAKKRPNDEAAAMRISDWDNYSIKQVVQWRKGPFYIASTHKTKLSDVATRELYATPDEIARLGYAIAHEIDNSFPAVSDLSAETTTLAKAIAKDLKEAKKPLIVSGSSLFSEEVIGAAANVAYALKNENDETGLIYTVPEVNTMGLSMLTDQFLGDASDRIHAEGTDVLITLENDLFRRMEASKVKSMFNKASYSIMLESLQNETSKLNDYVLPAGTFVEASGTVVNNEGRAQRFYQAYKPENDALSSWAWLSEIKGDDNVHLDEIVEDMIISHPILAPVEEVAPKADFREGTQKIPRSPHRYSGRTSMHAERDVSEEKPPIDKDSALSFTMEGFHGKQPPALTSFYWAPGWNSVQSINKYQIEVGGELHGGNPGKRLLEPGNSNVGAVNNSIPAPFAPKNGQKLALPIYYIYGSDELSAKSPAIAERIPETQFILNPADAAASGIAEGDTVSVELSGKNISLRVKFDESLASGTVGIPIGFKETVGSSFLSWVELKKG